MKKRAIVIVLDSVGIGEMPDASVFGDEGSHTIGNILKERGRLLVPNMTALGLSNIENSQLPPYEGKLIGAYGRAAEQTMAKDTTSGHWELMGLPMEVPFRTYPDGFPAEFVRAFEEKIGKGTLCNRSVSGTVVIAEMGDEHVKTGKPIIYTSADSVFQIAAHEGVIPLEELYAMCQIARDMLMGDMLVGRVIARPFAGVSGNYVRTQNRKDYAIPPPEDTVLDALYKKGKSTFGIGKIEDIFYHRGLSFSDHTHTNVEGIEATLKYMGEDEFDFLFVNLVDFDMLYGHRNNVEGYASALEYFDTRLPEILNAMQEQDILIITADHGCDPTTISTDHSREYIPILVAGKQIQKGKSIGTRKSFADVGATVFEHVTGERFRTGASFLKDLLT